MGRYRYARINDNYEKVNAKLTEAFKLLRKAGYVARKNYLCCSTCAGYALATYVSNLSEAKRAKVKGVIFYHHQDNDRLRERGNCHLAYGDVDTEKYGKIGLPTVEVGKELVKVLTEVGLETKWDGSPDSRIEVGVFKDA